MSPTIRRPHRSPQDVAAAHEASAHEYDQQAELEAGKPILGPRRETLSLAGAISLGERVRLHIAAEEAPPTESQRHLLVPLRATIIGFVIVGLVDLPVMAWISAGIFNVDPDRPGSLRLVIAIVVAILVTTGAATALHHSGNSLRNHKNYRRSLDLASLTLGSALTLLGAATLAVSIAALAYWRIATEGVLSRQGSLATLLAAVAAIVMLVSSALIAANAFRDGSHLTDDLAFLSRAVQRRLTTIKALQHKAQQHRHEAQLLRATVRAVLVYNDAHTHARKDHPDPVDLS